MNTPSMRSRSTSTARRSRRRCGATRARPAPGRGRSNGPSSDGSSAPTPMSAAAVSTIHWRSFRSAGSRARPKASVSVSATNLPSTPMPRPRRSPISMARSCGGSIAWSPSIAALPPDRRAAQGRRRRRDQHQRDHRCFRVRALAHRQQLPAAETAILGDVEAGRSRQDHGSVRTDDPNVLVAN